MQPPAAAPRGARESRPAAGREGEPAVRGPAPATEAIQAGERERTAQDGTLRAILDSASAPIFSVDRAYRYTSFNRAHAEVMAALYGARIELGRSLLEYMTVPADRAQAQRNLDRALAGESFTEEAFSGEVHAREYFGVAHCPIRDGAGEIVGASAVVTDLTARRRAEEALRESTARYRRNGDINAARLRLAQFAATHTLDELLQETLDAAEELTGSLIGFFHFIDDDQRAITLQSWSTRTKREFCKAEGKGSHYPIEAAGVWTDAVKARAPVVHNDYASLPHRRGMPEGHAVLVRELVVPVFRADKVTALLGVGNKPTDYDAEDVEAVFLLAELAWEIADRKHGEELLRRVNRQLRAISECNQALMRASDEQTILDEVCRIVCERAGYRMAWVGYAEHDEARSVRPVAVAGADHGYVAEVKASWGDGPRGQGPAGEAVRTGRTAAIQDLDASPEFGPWREAARARGYRAGICLPLKGEDGQVFGLLLIYAGETDAFSAGEIQLLEELAGDLAFGIAVLRGRARRNAAERQIALLSFALDNVREAAFLIDAQGRFRYVNGEACRALGFAQEELLARSVADVDPDFPLERWPAHWEELRQKRALLFEGRHRARDGRIFPVQVNASYFEFGGEGYNLALARDLTEHNRMEAQLRQAQKMEAIGTLAGGVAHDFNNILTGIIGYGNVIQEALGPEDPLQGSIEQILSASERAAQLTRALLAFSRKQVLNPKPLDLNEVVRGIERFLRRVIGEDIELSTELSAAPLVVMADVGQLEQVLMNLATNARDAMPRGGVLSIATGPLDVDAAYVASHGWGAPGTHAVLSVSDTGAGMDEATRQKLFEPFFTTKAAGKGTGLGLSIVYGIVKQHGGGVDVYSEPGKGTSFKIVLPLVAAPVEAPTPRPFAAPARGTETLLVAEDDAIVRGMIATVLGANGYRVVEAVDGEDAVARWAAHRDEIDMLVLDVVMPKRSGRDVYDAVRAERPEIPVLFLSGYTADIIHKKGLFDDGLQFLSKPHSPVVLLAKVRGILDDAQARAKAKGG